MNFHRVTLLVALTAGFAWSGHGQGPNPPAGAASQAEVNAGTIRTKFVSPYTAKNSTLVPASISNLVFIALGGTNKRGGALAHTRATRGRGAPPHTHPANSAGAMGRGRAAAFVWGGWWRPRLRFWVPPR